MSDWPAGLEMGPITTWPGTRTPSWERRSNFRADFSDTLRILNHELNELRATKIVLEVAIPAGDAYWRQDGRPRAHVKADHPGVVLTFHRPQRGSRKARDLRYATDRFTTWQQNLRAIALGLEALRKFDRYGLGDDAQYAGFAQLEAGSGPTARRGAELVREHGSVVDALKATHPDTGGERDDFESVQLYRQSAAT